MAPSQQAMPNRSLGPTGTVLEAKETPQRRPFGDITNTKTDTPGDFDLPDFSDLAHLTSTVNKRAADSPHEQSTSHHLSPTPHDSSAFDASHLTDLFSDADASLLNTSSLGDVSGLYGSLLGPPFEEPKELSVTIENGGKEDEETDDLMKEKIYEKDGVPITGADCVVKETDEDNKTEVSSYKCPACSKMYRGKTARSSWRRHLQWKHKIVMSLQKQSLGDDPARLAELRRERNLESKRRWACKKRKEKRELREAEAAAAAAALHGNDMFGGRDLHAGQREISFDDSSFSTAGDAFGFNSSFNSSINTSLNSSINGGFSSFNLNDTYAKPFDLPKLALPENTGSFSGFTTAANSPLDLNTPTAPTPVSADSPFYALSNFTFPFARTEGLQQPNTVPFVSGSQMRSSSSRVSPYPLPQQHQQQPNMSQNWGRPGPASSQRMPPMRPGQPPNIYPSIRPDQSTATSLAQTQQAMMNNRRLVGESSATLVLDLRADPALQGSRASPMVQPSLGIQPRVQKDLTDRPAPRIQPQSHIQPQPSIQTQNLFVPSPTQTSTSQMSPFLSPFSPNLF